MIHRKSNAIEIPMSEVPDEQRICDHCDTLADGVLYRWSKPSQVPRALGGKVRKPEVCLCFLCSLAYGRTMEINGWKKINCEKSF